MCTAQKIKANGLPSPPPPTVMPSGRENHLLHQGTIGVTLTHTGGSCSYWAEKRQGQDFPGPCPPRHSTNLGVSLQRWLALQCARSGGIQRGQPSALHHRAELAHRALGQLPQRRDITSSPAVLPKALRHEPAGLGAVWPLCIKHTHD